MIKFKVSIDPHQRRRAMRSSFALISLSSLLSVLLTLVLITLLQTPTTILAQNTTAVSLIGCPSSFVNYSSGSQFEFNLKNLLIPTLVSNGSLSGFFNTSSGTDQDIIYGLVQCRVDVSLEDCRSCLNIASVNILKQCPNKKDATIRYANCLFRYSNIRFYSILYSFDLAYYWDWSSVDSTNITDVVVFNQQLAILFNNLTSIASSKPSKFMTGSIKLDDFSKIYGLVDCTLDLSSTDCSTCLQAMLSKVPDCCRGTKGGWVISRSCEIWYKDYQFFQLLSPPPAPQVLTPQPPSPTNITVPPSSEPRGKEKPSPPSPNTGVIIGAALAAVAVLLLLVVVALCVCSSKRKRIKKDKYSGPSIMGVEDINSAESLQFEFDMIRTATKNFSNNNKLGEGGFGEVYKGDLPDGQEIAVKRLSKNSGQGLLEFKNEVVLLHKLQHRNLVRLLGYCLEGVEKLLIYEYIPNRSLDKHLFAPTKRAYLDWDKRYKIIGGIARGLLYLHEDSRLRIIHRDLKAANILLDGEMDAKIADFGMAKIFGSNQTQGNTSRLGGTFGYIAPEYAMHGLFSVKSDVFSFGVLVLEIISGQRITSFQKSHSQQNLLSYAWNQWREGTGLALLDPTLSDSFSEMDVMKSLNIGLLCVQEKTEKRPTMSSVVTMLNSNSLTMASPSQPAFFAGIETYSNMGTREHESDLYKHQTFETKHSIASSSTSDYTRGMGSLKTTPRHDLNGGRVHDMTRPLTSLKGQDLKGWI